MLVRLLAAEVRLVCLDDPAKEAVLVVIVVLLSAGFTDAVQEEPGRLLRDSDLLRQLEGRNTLPGSGQQIHREEPLVERDVRPLHDRSCTKGEIQPATGAAVVPCEPELVDRVHDAARGAGWLTVPALLLHVLAGCIRSGKHPTQFIGADSGLAHVSIVVMEASLVKYIVPFLSRTMTNKELGFYGMDTFKLTPK